MCSSVSMVTAAPRPRLLPPIKPHHGLGRASGADGRSEELLESRRPGSDVRARPGLSSAAADAASPQVHQRKRHKMLLLPPAALCCLCSALVATATQLIQEDVTLTRRVGQKVSFSCGRTEECDNDYIYWYQKKDTETFKLILDIYKTNGNLDKRYNHPQKDDFSSVNKGKGYELQIQTVKSSHSASYYCTCWTNHSEKSRLKSVQKPPDEETSTSVSDRTEQETTATIP